MKFSALNVDFKSKFRLSRFKESSLRGCQIWVTLSKRAVSATTAVARPMSVSSDFVLYPERFTRSCVSLTWALELADVVECGE